MLSEKGLQAREERRWGHLPLLRRALKDKQRPSVQWHTSIDDRIEDEIMRLFEIAAAAVELKADVWDVANGVNPAEVIATRRRVHDELNLLSEEIEGIAALFRGLSRRLDELHATIELTERPIDSQ